MSKGEREHKICWYCNALVAERHGQGDHFPTPERNGGVECVPCCTSCHDMKDRFPLGKWPMEWVEKVMADFPKVSRETRIFLAKVFALVSDIQTKEATGQGGVNV